MKKKAQRLTVEKLIGILKKCKHKRTAIVTFSVEEYNASVDEYYDVEYDMNDIGQFGVVPDVIINLTERAAEDYT